MEFKPTEDVLIFLNYLRELKLQWLADEIEQIFANGKIQAKSNEKMAEVNLLFGLEKDLKEATHNLQGNRQNLKGKNIDVLGSVPFNENEQFLILLKTIRSYSVGLSCVWSYVEENLPAIFDQDLKVSIINDKLSDKPLNVFPPDVKTHLMKLENLITPILSELNKEA